MSNETVLSDAQCLAIGAFGQSPLKRLAHARAVERATLQSEQVQALRKDAERLRYILDRVCMIQAASYGCKFEILNLPPHFGDCEPDPVAPFLSAIDAAMQEQKP